MVLPLEEAFELGREIALCGRAARAASTEERGHPHRELIARAEAAAISEAETRWGARDYVVHAETQKGCCVHLSVRHGARLLGVWRYTLEGEIVDDR